MNELEFRAHITKLVKDTIGKSSISFAGGSLFISHVSQDKAILVNKALIKDLGDGTVQMHCIVPGGQYVFDFV